MRLLIENEFQLPNYGKRDPGEIRSARQSLRYSYDSCHTQLFELKDRDAIALFIMQAASAEIIAAQDFFEHTIPTCLGSRVHNIRIRGRRKSLIPQKEDFSAVCGALDAQKILHDCGLPNWRIT
jgi:hypothetical protein